MDEALRALLLETAAIAALVERRIDWGLRRQGAPLPAVCLFGISGLPGMTFSGPIAWSRSRVQIDCWGRTFKAARDLGDAIGGLDGVLNGFRGTVGGARLRTFVIDKRDSKDADGAGALFNRSIDVMVFYGR